MSVDASQEDRSPGGFFFWLCFATGLAIIAYGLWYLFANSERTSPTYSLLFAFGSNVLHDAALVPATCAVGYIVVRTLPTTLRGPVAWGLITSAAVLALAFVPLSGFGRRADNPTVLPLDYVSSTATALGVVWAIVLVLITAKAVMRRRST